MTIDTIQSKSRASVVTALEEEAARSRDICTKKLLRQKKLHLVLDIDHTLIHSVRLEKLNPDDVEYLKDNAESLRDSLVMLEVGSFKLLVKFRPSVHSFLKEASSLFEMYLYTRGERLYAISIAQLLDPQGIYFGNRIITRQDTPDGFKTLKLVAAQDRAVLIVDDTEFIWPDDKQNLILIDKYRYFEKDENGIYFMRESDESDIDGGLATTLRIIRELHAKFFEQDDVDVDYRDIRLLMKSVRDCRVHRSCCIWHLFNAILLLITEPLD